MAEHDAARGKTPPLAAWFLGPKAEHGTEWQELLSYVFGDYIHWRRNHFPDDPVTITRMAQHRPEHAEWNDELTTHLDHLLNRLKAHFPFYSPRYIAHMLSEQTLPSVLGYFAGMLYNPNNVTDEAAPVTVDMELEVGRLVAEMLGYDSRVAWAHLCSGGTIANLEALWVARSVQLVPFMVRDFCTSRELDFTVHTANLQSARIQDLDSRQLVGLRPNESIFMMGKLAQYLHQEGGRSLEEARTEINAFMRACEYNPKYQGFHAVLSKIGLKPVIFVTATAHYSIAKACNVLGYGEDRVRAVPTTRRFRMDVEQLRSMLEDIGPDTYVAAVVGILGSTEEGAVDPIHRIKFLREEVCRDQNRSFWLHVDAAWGGYIASLFQGHDFSRRRREPALPDVMNIEQGMERLEAAFQEYRHHIGAERIFTLELERQAEPNRRYRSVRLHWDDPEVYKAFLALKTADSITVDPHKLGYVPYPAGIVAFKNGLVTELTRQRAQYISDIREGIASVSKRRDIQAIGPYILEGSKPGAVAAACWLAHTTIPLTVQGHGAIMRETLLNAKRLCRYLHFHKHLFEELEEACVDQPPVHPFTFRTLFEPDTNIVCFVAVPMDRRGDQMVPLETDLKRLNVLNESIYRALSIESVRLKGHLPYGHPFYVSRTTFESMQYSAESIGEVLGWLGVSKEEYEARGLFVLRSTVMNPLYHQAEEAGCDYLRIFVAHLHGEARRAMLMVYGGPPPCDGHESDTGSALQAAGSHDRR